MFFRRRAQSAAEKHPANGTFRHKSRVKTNFRIDSKSLLAEIIESLQEMKAFRCYKADLEKLLEMLTKLMMIPYYRPYYDYRELLAALTPVPARQRFTAAMARHARVRYGLDFTYGRAGLFAILHALKITDAEIILPAYTCMVVAHTIEASGNHPVFVDIDLANYNMALEGLKHAMTKRTRVVVATHLYGYPVDVAAIREIVGGDVFIVEDCALGVQMLAKEGRGIQGDFGIFSFGAAKPLSVYEGGIVVTDSADLYEAVKAYRDVFMTKSSPKSSAKRWGRFLSSYMLRKCTYQFIYRLKYGGHTSTKSALPPDHLPYDANAILPEFQSRIGLIQLQKLEVILQKRRALAQTYDNELHDCIRVFPAPLVDSATYSHYTIRVPHRDQIGFIQRMVQCGVAVDSAYKYALPYLAPYRSPIQGDFPRAAQAAREVINLPCYPHLDLSDVHYIIACVAKCAKP